MKRTASTTATRVREALRYDPDTGLWTYRIDRGQYKAGDPAGHVRRSGKYHVIVLDGVLYMAHRLAVLYMTGEWPAGDVDHIDGERANNRWANLRDASRAINAQNRRSPSRNNTTGFLGVVRMGSKFMAQIERLEGGKRRGRSAGTFDTPEEAHAAYVNAKRALHEGNTL